MGTQLYQFKFPPMGSQCKNISSYQLSSDFSVIQPQLHPAFGQILYLKSQKLHIQKAVKRLSYLKQMHYQTLQSFRERIQLVRQCESVATLIKIYDYQIVEKYSQQAKVWTEIEGISNCQQIEYPFVLLHFQYIPIQQCLSSILQTRLISLQKAQRKYGNQITGKVRSIKLNDYQSIDTLQSQQRQLINVFYQEIEIVRMIDHLVGALYFLHHYGITHGAVRPECVMVDSQGKYILADRDLLMQDTNYDKALSCKEKVKNQSLDFMAPEWREQIRLGRHSSGHNGQKSDIFCLGILALKMCLLDSQEHLFEYDFTSKSILFKEQLMQKMLIQVQNKYSQELTFLLKDMTQITTENRIDYAQLIDRLNPLLLQNLHAIKLIYNPPQKLPSQTNSQKDIPKSQRSHSPKFQVQERSLLKQSLISMEQKFQKIMNNRSLLMHRALNQQSLREQEERILSRLKQIQTAKTALRSTTARKNNPEKASPSVNNFQLSHASRPESPKNYSKNSSKLKEPKRYMTGKELQAIVWRQYENLKSKRGHQ